MAKLNDRCFCCFTAAMFVPLELRRAQTWRLHTKLYTSNMGDKLLQITHEWKNSRFIEMVTSFSYEHMTGENRGLTRLMKLCRVMAFVRVQRLLFFPLIWTILYVRYILIQTLIITLSRNAMLTIPKIRNLVVATVNWVFENGTLDR